MSEPPNPLIFRAGVRGLPRRSLRAFAASLQDAVAPGREFCCLLTGDRELQRLNSQFLGHDYPTDVLSFPSAGPDGFLGGDGPFQQPARPSRRASSGIPWSRRSAS